MPSIRQTAAFAPLLKIASGALYAAASSQVSDAGKLGTDISGLGAGKTCMS